MAKKNKNKQSTSKQPTVSIVTITQFKRFPCLLILRDLIKDQTYDNIIQWVLVEGSKNENEAKLNSDNISNLKKNLELELELTYIPWQKGIKLGELRNRGNKACTGDITVVMDDDDYYFPERVEHAVHKLTNSNCNIAGVSAVMIYDYFLEKLYKFKQFAPYHSTNNCMAWKKAYLLTNSHDPEKELAEEASFTKKFSEPLVQLETEKSIVVSSHDGNTFNKRELLAGGTNKLNPSLYEVPNILNYIKEPYFKRYQELFVIPGESEYDIEYFAGGFSIKWDPRDKSLGGSEQAIVNLVNNWAKKGKKVAVYGEVPEINFENVDYISWKKFKFEYKHKVVILWRLYGLWCAAPFPLKAEQIYLDCHDNFGGQFPDAWKNYGSVVNKIFFKSNFHREEFEKHNNCKLDKDRYVIIPNGVRTEEFIVNKEKVVRNPYRFCYCSCYMRGLIEIVQFIWPVIYQFEPRAELHVYYGMNNIRDEKVKEHLVKILAQPGVMDHGRQPVDIIAREKHLSSYQLYVTNTPIEIDCISIRESLATGCIPILSNYGVFKDRDGVHFDLDNRDPKCFQQIGFKIVQLMKQNDKLTGYREQIKKSKLLVNWEQVGDIWLEEMKKYTLEEMKKQTMEEIMDKETIQEMCKEMNKEIILTTLTHENNSPIKTVLNTQLVL
jgi:glycosyltransferase involved in cell wall biosynthesis